MASSKSTTTLLAAIKQCHSPDEADQESHKVHAEVELKVIKGRLRYQLFSSRHEPIAANQAAIDSFSKPQSEWLPEQKEALKALRSMIQGWRAASTTEHGVPSKQYMRLILLHMSALYFMDTLSRTRFVWDPTLLPVKKLYGLYNYGQDGKWATITIDPHPVMYDIDTHYRMKHILSTLLHECVHAFQWKTFCRAECGSPDCLKEFSRIQGEEGHGSAYFILASHVHAAATRDLGLDVTLGATFQLKATFDYYRVYPSEAHVELCHESWQNRMRKTIEALRLKENDLRNQGKL